MRKLPNKQKTTLVTFDLPISVIDDLKTLAHKYAVSFQSLIKIFLAEKVREEFHPKYQ